MGWRKRLRIRKEDQGSRHPVRGDVPTREPPRSERRVLEVSLDPRLSHAANLGLRTDLLRVGQQALGNRALQRLLHPKMVQAKLTVNRPGDAYEQEADRVAEAVTQPQPAQLQTEEEGKSVQAKPLAGAIAPLVQRQETPEEEEEQAQAKPLAGASALVQRQEEQPEEEEPVQMKASPGRGLAVSPRLEERIHSVQGGGEPLPVSLRAFFEPRFGRDFGQVHIHTDGAASAVARSLRARAFTTGRHVVFGSGVYAPGTHEGRRLLAHELTHVVQQVPLAMNGRRRTTRIVRPRRTPAVPARETFAAWATRHPGLIPRHTRVLGQAGFRLITKARIGGTWREPSPAELPALTMGQLGWSIGPLPGGTWEWVTYRNFESKCRRIERQYSFYARFRRLLVQAPAGRRALELASRHRVKLTFRRGGGSEFDPSSNTIFMDTTESAGDAALTFVHEMSHAEWEHTGRSPTDARRYTRADFIKKQLEDETDATVKAIAAKVELKGARVDMSRVTAPLERDFMRAYKTAVTAAKARNPRASDEDLNKVGKEAGTRAVFQGFMTGRVVISTSRTPKTYPVYYGEYWDKVNRPRRRGRRR